jgi:UDP-N-acetylmuramate dehydrogenase
MQVQKDFSLKKYNTFGTDATARYFSRFFNTDELRSIIENNKNITTKMILGGGSNILFTENYDGLVLKNEISGMNKINEDKNYVYVKAGGGVRWHNLVMFCVNQNLGGLENLSLIPGNVGASPMQNIGAYGVEIKDVFYELEAFHLKEKEVQIFSGDDCKFDYRDSVFKNKYKDQFAILNVTYRLKKDPDFNISYGALQAELEKMNVTDLTVKAISDAVINIRTSKLPDPAVIGNAGSFFKNPVITSHRLYEIHRLHENEEKHVPFYKIDEEHFKIPAGWLIEKCGWKGYRKGDAGCYAKQALVLVNYGKASGEDIYDLSEEIKISVRKKFGIDLEREVNIL